MKNSRDSLAFVSGVVLGAAIGGILGVLFAPESGEDTRKKLAKKGKKALKDLKEEANEARKKLEPKIAAVKREVGKKVEDVKEGFISGMKSYQKK